MQGLQHLDHFHCFPKAISREPDWEGSSQDRGCPYGTSAQQAGFRLLCHSIYTISFPLLKKLFERHIGKERSFIQWSTSQMPRQPDLGQAQPGTRNFIQDSHLGAGAHVLGALSPTVSSSALTESCAGSEAAGTGTSDLIWAAGAQTEV